MHDEQLISIAVPQNLPDDFQIGGVPLREIAFCLVGPLAVAVVMRFVDVDFFVPFPVIGSITFTNVLIWVCGPISFLALRAWKKRNPDIDLTDAVRGFFGRRSWMAGARDLELPAYLIDPFDQDAYVPGTWSGGEEHVRARSYQSVVGA